MHEYFSSKKAQCYHIKRSLLASAITATIAASSHAQDNSAEQLLEETEVVGMRANLQSAQALKQEANTVKDVITAADIGALPDKSVTEALMRVPGTTIERFAASDDPNHFAAEGTGVVIRGLKRVRSEINGRDSFSARRDGSGLNFEDIPPELLGRVEVIKNTTADLIAGGVAGTVNLVTRKPFDSDKQQIFISAKGSYGDHIDEWSPAYSGLFSDNWDTAAGKFGFLISGSHSEYEDRGDGVALYNFYERSATANEMPQFGQSGTELNGYPGQTLYVPAGVSIRTSDSERERTGLTTSAQWLSPNEQLEITAEYIKSNAQLSWDERVLQYGEQGFNVDPNNIDVSDASFDAKGFMTSGTLLMANSSVAQSHWRESENDIEDISLHATYRPSSNLSLDFDVQRIDSTSKTLDYTISNRFSNDDTYFNTAGDRLSANYLGDNLTSPVTHEEMFIDSAMDKEDDYDADATSYAFDIEYTFDEGWLTSLKAGAYHSNKEKIIRDSSWNWGAVSVNWLPYSGGGYSSNVLDHPELYEKVNFSSSDFHGGGVLPNDINVLFPNMSDVHNWQNYHASTSVENGGFSGFTPLRQRECVLEGGVECQLQGAYLPSEISTSEEERTEFYLMAGYSFNNLAMPIKGNIGLRHVSWEVTASGATQFPEPIPAWWELWNQPLWNSYTVDERNFQNNFNTLPAEIKGTDYDTILPSFNISMAVTDEQIIRFAASKNVFFPTFIDVRNFRTITGSYVEEFDNNGNVTHYSNISFDGRTGNPQIEPEEAINYDLTYEWYFDTLGSLSVSLFYKELDGIIRERLFTEEVTNPESNTTQSVNFTQKTNEGDGNIQGFELAYQQFYDTLPGAWSGLGLSFNYTNLNQTGINDEVGFGDGVSGDGGRNNFRAFTDLDLPGYSDDTVNLALMYEKYGLSARLAYNWRSEYLLARRDANLFAPVIAESTGQLDASISYQVSEHFKLGVDASNLLNEIISTKMVYNQAGDTTPRNNFKTDTRYGVFAQMKF